MTEQEITNNLNAMLEMVHDGKIIEAIDRFYHDDLVTQEGVSGMPLEGGKQAYLNKYRQFLSDMTRVTTFKGTAGQTGKNVSTIKWELDFDNKGENWGAIKMNELAVQEWQDGKIFRETFFYKN
jgi:hypothetical protein